MIRKVCNRKRIDKANKKIVEIQSNQSNGNNNTAYTHLKFVNFLSIKNQVILSNL